MIVVVVGEDGMIMGGGVFFSELALSVRRLDLQYPLPLGDWKPSTLHFSYIQPVLN